jgi:hypothetical protein
MARCEFRKGDVLVQIGEPFKWLILGVERTGQMWMYKTISEIGLREGDKPNNWPIEWIERDSVKVGEWDFEDGKEVEDD